MSKPEAFSIPNNTNMTCNTSYHPLPVSHIKEDENMQAVDRSEKVSALPCGIFYSVPVTAVATVHIRCFEAQCFKAVLKAILLHCSVFQLVQNILIKLTVVNVEIQVLTSKSNVIFNVMVFPPKREIYKLL